MTDIGVQSEPPYEPTTPVEPGQESSLLARQQRLRASEGYRAMALKDRVKRMGFIFQGNVTQYMMFVASLQNPAISLPIMDVRNPDAHDHMLSEAERLLHNVLTSMSTRVDQQRAFMERYFSDDAELTKEYLDRVASAFIADPQARFLKDLRNYITHHQLPVAESKQTLGLRALSITFTLPCEPLLRWGGWSGGTKAFTAGCGEAVAVVDVVKAYARKAGEFDKWLFDRIGLKYAADIDVFLREQVQFTRDFDRVFGP